MCFERGDLWVHEYLRIDAPLPLRFFVQFCLALHPLIEILNRFLESVISFTELMTAPAARSLRPLMLSLEAVCSTQSNPDPR